MATTQKISAPAMGEQLLHEVEAAARRGDRQRAYQLSKEATEQAPASPAAWIWRGETADTLWERVSSLSRAAALAPQEPALRQKMYEAMKGVLQRNPFLAYVNEAEQIYHVQTDDGLSLTVPKDREVPEAYPKDEPKALRWAYRFLGLSLLGVWLAGLAALLFAPVALLLALHTEGQALDRANQVRARVVITVSACFFAIAVLLGALFLMHVWG